MEFEKPMRNEIKTLIRFVFCVLCFAQLVFVEFEKLMGDEIQTRNGKWDFCVCATRVCGIRKPDERC